MKTETILEFTHSGGVSLGVDKESGVIRGVKLLGLESQNGRTYLKEAVARALQLYEGAKVNVDHPDPGPQKAADRFTARSYGDRMGVIRNVRLDSGDGGIRGDFHANPKHGLFEQLAWDAANSPEAVGFSHNILGKTSRRDGRTVVEEITRVQSVDLVADPATTRGLFEHTGDEEIEVDMGENTLTLASLKADHPGLVKQLLTEAMNDLANGEASQAKDALIKEQATKLDAFEAGKALDAKRAKVDAALKEAKLPEELATELFIEQLIGAKDDAAITALIEDRAGLVRATSTPRSREQNLSEGTTPASSKDIAARWVA